MTVDRGDKFEDRHDFITPSLFYSYYFNYDNNKQNNNREKGNK